MIQLRIYCNIKRNFEKAAECADFLTSLAAKVSNEVLQENKFDLVENCTVLEDLR